MLAVMILNLLPTIPFESEAAAAPAYIASIGIAQDKHESDAKNELSGHTIINRDLNDDAGGDYVYIGYKTSTDPSKAITGIVFRVGENPPRFHHLRRIYLQSGRRQLRGKHSRG